MSIDKLKKRLELFQSLTLDSKRNWGIMSPQHMIEHLGGVFYATAMGKKGKMILSPEDSAKMKKRFFTSYYPFPKEVKMPRDRDAPTALKRLRYTSLEEAAEKMHSAVQLFLTQYEKKEGITATHGYFGEMNLKEWLALHIKHLEHHAMQFSLLPRDEKIPEIESLLYKVKSKIQTESEAKWGKMTAHQMIEHLGVTFVFSTGRIDIPFKGAQAVADQKWEAFLKSDDPWIEAIPGIDIGDPRPTRKPTIEESKQSLFKSFYNYLEYCEANPEAKHPHLVMGDRTIDEWRIIHVKHLQHHLRQFGVV